MANLNIDLKPSIHAEIAEGSFNALSNSSVTLDPITKSYSTSSPLKHYLLEAVYSNGVTNAVILQNGKNSRFSCTGKGYVQIQLYIEDELGNSDTDLIIITVE